MSSSLPRENHAPHPRDQRTPRRLQLTEEEKAVLVECRRNSIARGLPLGVGALLTLRWFIHQGRVPTHVTRWTGLYYTGAFLGAFYVGVASYKQTCMDKIMALENSVLKDQLKKDLPRLRGYGDLEDQSYSPPPPRDNPPNRWPHPPPTRSTPHTPPPDITMRQGPSISTGYKKDKQMLETELESQPDAFGSYPQHVDNTPAYTHTTQEQPSRVRGRTYDDIRESARRRNSDGRGGRKQEEEDEDWRQRRTKRRVVRKNKYGDDIEE